MQMRTQFQVHDGVRICHLDFTHLASEDEFLKLVTEAKQVISAEPPKSVYTITDVTGSRATPRLRAAFQDLSEHNKQYVLFGAVVGLTSIQRVVLRGIIQLTGRKLITTESIAAAVTALQREASKG